MKSLNNFITEADQSIPKFIVLYTGKEDGKTFLKWAKCSSKKDAKETVDTLTRFYGKGEVEIYDIRSKVD